MPLWLCMNPLCCLHNLDTDVKENMLIIFGKGMTMGDKVNMFEKIMQI